MRWENEGKKFPDPVSCVWTDACVAISIFSPKSESCMGMGKDTVGVCCASFATLCWNNVQSAVQWCDGQVGYLFCALHLHQVGFAVHTNLLQTQTNLRNVFRAKCYLLHCLIVRHLVPVCTARTRIVKCKCVQTDRRDRVDGKRTIKHLTSAGEIPPASMLQMSRLHTLNEVIKMLLLSSCWFRGVTTHVHVHSHQVQSNEMRCKCILSSCAEHKSCENYDWNFAWAGGSEHNHM